MANVDSPRGFRLYQTEGNTVRTRVYTKTAATVILEGALLKRVAAGTIEPATAADTDPYVGIASRYSPSTETTIDVIDDPDATYVCQATGTYAVADNGQNVDIAVGSATGPDSKRSGSEVDMATKATTATLPFKIIGLAPLINGVANDAGADADLLVVLNQSERGAGTAGI